MNKQRKLTRKEKIKLAKTTDKALKQPPASPVRRSVHTSSPLLTNKWLILFLLGLIVLITFITFSDALKNDLTNWDDSTYISENPALAKPIKEAIKYFFSQNYYANYTPLTMITYALEYHSIGVRPELYHLVNVLIHLLNVIMMFWFIYLLSGKKIEVAAIVSLFFGIHPMHVESVAWVSELKDVLYTFFFIGGMITYYKYIQSPKSKIHYSLTFILFVLSGLSKPAAVIFPVVLLLLDFYTKRKWNKYVWLEKLPFFIVSFIFGIITMKAQEQSQAIGVSFTLFQRLMFASYSMLDYIIKLFFPVKLAADYAYPHLLNGHLPAIFYVMPFIVLLLFYGVYLTFRYSRLILFGFLFFLANIALVLQVLSVGNAIMADRYTYLPYTGLFFIIAMGFSTVYNGKERKLSVYKVPAIIVIIILAITSSYLSYARCKVWKNSETLWTDVLNKFPDNTTALNNKAYCLLNNGQYKEAMILCTQAIQIQPKYDMAYVNLAKSYKGMHDYDNALKYIDIVLKFSPDDFKALNTKACILFEERQYKDAMKLYNEAIKLNPQFVDAYTNIASCYFMVQDYDNAISYWSKSLEFNPYNAGTYKMLGLGYQKKGDKNLSDAYFAKAKELEGNRKQ